MSRKFFLAATVLCALAYLLSGQRPPRATARRIAAAGNRGFLRDAVMEQRVRAAISGAPLSFEENLGQTDPRVKFVARGSNFMLFLTPQEAALQIHTPTRREKRPPQLEPEGLGWADALAASALVRVEFAGGNPAARLTGVGPQPGTINYIKGNDPSHWRRNVPHFGRVRYEGLYPGIDAVFYGGRQQMEFDFVVAPGADPSAIRMRLEGAGSVELTEEGGLEARTPAGILTLLPPKLYEQRDGSRPEIAGRYVWRAPGELGFEVAAYDRSHALVIDPVANVDEAGNRPHIYAPAPPSSAPPTGGSVALSTLLGGTFDDSIQAIAIGPTSGHVYVTGWTDSNDFPTASPTGTPFQSSFRGGFFNGSCSIPQFPCGDAFVAEFDVSTISAPKLVSSTYFGGTGDEAAWGVALDANDNVYLVGETDSGDFPMNSTVSGFDTALPVGGCSTNGQVRACRHVFFSQFDSTLTVLKYSTFLAGSDDDEGYGIAVNGTGKAFLTGVAGPNFPIVNNLGQTPFQSAYLGAGDVFVAEIDPTVAGAGGLLYSTYLGGDGTDVGFAIAVDSNNNAYIGGVTFSTNGVTNFPTTAGFGSSTNDLVACSSGGLFACGDGFVSVINATGSALNYSAFLGGSFADQVNAIAIDGANNVYATGQTQSGDFQPVSKFFGGGGAPFQFTNFGGYDAFVVKFPPNPALTTIDYATYLGGQNDDFGNAIAIDTNGDAFVSGTTFTPLPGDPSFPLKNPLQATTTATFSNSTSFVSVLNFAGGALLFSTYYGGSDDFNGAKPNDFGNAIALDSGGRIYLGGRTTSITSQDNTTNGLPFASSVLCLINPVPNANADTNLFADNNGFLVIINPTNSASACFSPSLTMPSPLTFTFTPTLQNMTNAQTQVLTIFNQGSAPLTNTISFGGTNTADFPIPATDITSCATVVAAGVAPCQLHVMFKPTAATGAVAVAESATLIISNNANCPAANPCTVSLNGTGLPLATVTLAPTPPAPGTNPFTYPGTTAVGSSSTAQAFLLTNTSTTSPVDISSVALGGANPGEFTITADFCTGVQVQPNNATCTILVAFSPNVSPPGARSATLTVMDDATTNPSFGLSATSVLLPPIVSIPPLSLTFGPQVQGTTSTAQMVTITNTAAAGSSNLVVTQPLTFTGTNSADFAATGCTTAVAPAGGQCTITVTFAPLAGAAGSRTATLQIADNATNSPQFIGVSGTDLALPTISLNPNPPAALTFLAQVLMTPSAAMNVMLANTSATSPLSITTVMLNGGNMGDFAIQSNGCGSSLAAGANCVVSLTFTPTAAGMRTTSLQFTDNATGSPQSVTINGTGVTAPTAALTAAITFATPQQINTTSASMAATLTNGGGSALPITSIGTTGDFAVVSNTCGNSLAANSNCTINVTFTPMAAGMRMGTLTVIDSVGTQMTMLMGTGVTPPAVTLSPPTSAANPLVFGTQAIGVTSASMAVTLMNTGGSPLTISTIAAIGDFAETDVGCLTGVAAGGMCTINITFTPSSAGTRTGSILIADNAANSPQTIFLSGTGSGSVPGFNLSAPLFFGAVLVNSTSPTQTITVTNSGGATLTIMSVTASAQFGVPSNTCGSVPVGQNCTIGVNFTPAAVGLQNGTLTIMDNAPGNPHKVALSGIGATISIAPPAGGSTSLTVTPGDTGQFNLTATSTPPGVVASLQLTCVSSAPFSLCSVSPTMATLGGGTFPSFVVTVRTNCNPSLVFRPTGPAPPILPAPFAALWLGAIVLFALVRRLAPQSRLSHAVPVLLLLLLVVTWAGCINNPPPAIPGAPTTPAGTYNVTVTVTGVNGTQLSQQVQLTLRVI